ncbi:MAG: hypothetical protein AAF447_17805 [Myxococcota bacterium]
MPQTPNDETDPHRLRVVAQTQLGRVLQCGCGGTCVLELGAVSLRFDAEALVALESLLCLANARGRTGVLAAPGTTDARSLS